MADLKMEDIELLSQSPERLVFCSSRKTSALVLMIFSIIWGAIPAAMAIPSLRGGTSNVPLALVLIFAVMGLCLFLFGMSLFFLRTEVTLDRLRRTVFILSGTWRNRQETQHSFDEMKEVHYAKEVRNDSEGGSYTVWVADLISSTGDNLRMGTRTSQGTVMTFFNKEDRIPEIAMRGRSEMIAKFLNIPMRDSTSGEDHIRMADELDLPLAELMRRSGEEIAVSSNPPGDSRIIVERGPSSIRYRLPAQGLNIITAFSIIPALLWTGFALFWTSGAFRALSASRQGGIFFAVPLAGLLFIGIGFYAFILIAKEAMGTGEITITPESLKYAVVLGNWCSDTQEIPLNKVEEVRGGSSGIEAHWKDEISTQKNRLPSFLALLMHSFATPILIASDVGIVKTGKGLPDNDLQWLRNSIRAEIFRFSGR